MRAQLGNLHLADDRYLNGGSTTANYAEYANKHKFAPNSLTLTSGTQAHWLGRSDAAKVLVYFHGAAKLLMYPTLGLNG